MAGVEEYSNVNEERKNAGGDISQIWGVNSPIEGSFTVGSKTWEMAL
jgi:hypothetical protein